MQDLKRQYLNQWTEILLKAARSGAIGGRPLEIYQLARIAGPRAAVIEIHAGLDAGRLLRALSQDDFALHRQFVPFDFVGSPSVFMAGRNVRLEAGWPDSLAEKDIPLSSIGANPKDPTRWIAGKNELGYTVTAGVSDRVPHWLIGGMSGSGKTIAIRSALGQLARNAAKTNVLKFVLIDAKWGEGLGALAHIANRAGPLATNPDEARCALAWTLGEMTRRYEILGSLVRSGSQSEHQEYIKALPHLIVAIDEIQELTTAGQDANIAMIRQLTAQGRAAKIHLIIGTQHPVMDAFGSSQTKRNLAGRLALHTDDAKASEVVVGKAEPRADRLLGAGDAYIVAPGTVSRTQIAYMTRGELKDLPAGQPELAEWPDFRPEDAQTAEAALYDADEVALALLSAKSGEGRDRLKARFVKEGLPQPGSPKAGRLRDFGRDVLSALMRRGYDIREGDLPLEIE